MFCLMLKIYKSKRNKKFNFNIKIVINQLIEFGETKRGWLGVRIQDVTKEIAEVEKLDKPRGALVASVAENSPSEKAGIKAGDIILEFNGERINQMKELPAIVARTQVGKNVEVKIWRDKQEIIKNVLLGRLETSEDFKVSEKQKTIDDILPEAFAVVREASKRTLKMRHFDVQLIGGIVLHEGKIAEMKTGEGKTLAATLPVYLNVIAGKSVHIVTVNDYLAKRDSEWMGQIYNFLNLSVGCVNSQTPHENRPREYEKDVVYATNNEIGFDYLRDNLKSDYESLCFKKDAFAIVDEVDSILIDEARTPLVISAESNTSVDLFPQINKIIKLFKDSDYEINEEGKSVLLTNEGMEFAEKLLLENNLIKEGTLQDLDNKYQLITPFLNFQEDYLVQ